MRPTAELVVAQLVAREPTLGRGRLLCVDGPAGSGKTTLAASVAALVEGAVVVHMDDLFQGWDGLPHADRQHSRLLRPLAERRAGHWTRWDWHAGRWAETHRVDPGPLLVLEGVGSGAASHADLHTLLVWVEAPLALRRERGLARDGDDFAPHWDRWAADERRLFAQECTRERADVLVDGRDGSLRESQGRREPGSSPSVG